jgi:hypothetical protein
LHVNLIFNQTICKKSGKLAECLLPSKNRGDE